jgi:uncharacterized membrane protein
MRAPYLPSLPAGAFGLTEPDPAFGGMIALARPQPGPREPEIDVQELGKLLLEGGLESLSKRERRVIAAIVRHRHVTPDVNRTIEENETAGERIADRVARFGGSWTFILLFVGFLVAWILLNTVLVSRIGRGFDLYPFIFLNLMLSMVAALQAPIILMSQNRQASRDRIAAALDYEVNLKAELEIMALHEKLDALRIGRLEQTLDDQQRLLASILDAVHTSPTSYPGGYAISKDKP